MLQTVYDLCQPQPRATCASGRRKQGKDWAIHQLYTKCEIVDENEAALSIHTSLWQSGAVHNHETRGARSQRGRANPEILTWQHKPQVAHTQTHESPKHGYLVLLNK